jgi:hypothetical protein
MRSTRHRAELVADVRGDGRLRDGVDQPIGTAAATATAIRARPTVS